ncbi:MAG TPA: ParB/RepB/Spo0J family partition protein [Syntrophomonadaceae bacterium]|nr:ParB/RepB/Spo0J family partition protein [Syntrophomonadaceae bacterium]
MAKNSRGLGRGLDALLSGDQDSEYSMMDIDIRMIKPGPGQPRQVFAEEALSELADSIRQYGMLQPMLLRPVGGLYQIVAGERRWRAAQIAGIEAVPAIVKEFDDKLAAEISLVENLQREDLSSVEEARALRRLMDEFNYTQEQLGERIGKSRSHVANTLRILQLPDEILTMLEKGQLTAGHARTLVGLEQGKQLRLARRIAGEQLSVRDAEREVRTRKPQDVGQANMGLEAREIQDQLQRHLGTRVKLLSKRKGGRIEIPYQDEDDLERILEIIGVQIG